MSRTWWHRRVEGPGSQCNRSPACLRQRKPRTLVVERLEDRTLLNFNPPVHYAVGDQPLGVALGDFNGDGLLDLVTANHGSRNVSVLLGNGDTTFQGGQLFDTIGTPRAVAVGEFNPNGVLDIVTANDDNDTVSVLLGNGDGTFQFPQLFPVGFTPVSVAVGDFNGDGKLDIVTANSRGNTVSVLLGRGDGTFQPARNFPACGIIDHSDGFNRHGDLQQNGSAQFTAGLGRLTDDFGQAGSFFSLARAGIGGFFTTSFTFRFHEGTQPNPADGITFTLQANSPTALGASGGGLGYQGIGNSVAIKFDIFNNEGETDNSTGIFFDGDFPGLPHSPGEVNVPLDPNVINLRNQNSKRVDLAYDGTTLVETITDLFTHGTFTTSYAVDIPAKVGGDKAYLGFTGGTGGFFAVQDVQTWKFVSGGTPSSVAVGDFDNNGKLDVAVTCSGNDTVSVLLGNGDGTLQPPLNFDVGSSPQSVAVGDFNGDGNLDLAVANTGSNTVSVLLGNGDGTFRTAVNYAVGSRPESVAAGKINLRGHPPDLVTANSASNNVSVLLGTGDGTFRPAVPDRDFDAGSGPFAIALGDFGPAPPGPTEGWQSGAVTNPGMNSGAVEGNDCSWSKGNGALGSMPQPPDGSALAVALAASVNTPVGGKPDALIHDFTDSAGIPYRDTVFQHVAGCLGQDSPGSMRGDRLDLFFLRPALAPRAQDRGSIVLFDRIPEAVGTDEES